MARLRNPTRPRKAVGLGLEKLEDRSLLSNGTCTLTGGVLETGFCTENDFIEVDRYPAAGAVRVLFDYQTFSFAAADVQSVRITNMRGNDLVLVDTNLGLPVYLETDFGGKPAAGWVTVNPLPGVGGTHVHPGGIPGTNFLHWVINGYNFQTAWDLFRPGDGSEASRLAQIAAGLSESGLAAAAGAGVSLLDGHLFHSLAGGTGLTMTDLAGTAGHGAAMSLSAAGAAHDPGSSLHDFMLNPPFQGVDHKPG